VQTSHAGAIAGGVIGGLLAVVAFGALIFVLVRRLRSERAGYRAERGWSRTPAWDGRNKSAAATEHHGLLPRYVL
jgi:uncharacterized membrane protein